MVDVLSFAVVDHRSTFGTFVPEGQSRQIAINGALLANGGAGTTLLHDSLKAEFSIPYLRQLLGDEITDELDEGRTPLGYCELCFSNDGQIFAADVEFGAEIVTWSRVGWDVDSGPSDARWDIASEDPELIYTFDRSAYERVIRAEIERVKAGL